MWDLFSGFSGRQRRVRGSLWHWLFLKSFKFKVINMSKCHILGQPALDHDISIKISQNSCPLYIGLQICLAIALTLLYHPCDLHPLRNKYQNRIRCARYILGEMLEKKQKYIGRALADSCEGRKGKKVHCYGLNPVLLKFLC